MVPLTKLIHRSKLCIDCGLPIERGRQKKAIHCYSCYWDYRAEKDGQRKKDKWENMVKKKECLFCDKKRDLIHHINLNRQDNKQSNLIPLCGSCHAKIHKIILKPFRKN